MERGTKAQLVARLYRRGASQKDNRIPGYRYRELYARCVKPSLRWPISADVGGRQERHRVLPESASRGLSTFTYTGRHDRRVCRGSSLFLDCSKIFPCLNRHGCGFMIAVKAVALPNSESAALLRFYALQALRPGVLMLDTSCVLAGIRPTNLNTLLTLERLASRRLLLLLYRVFKWSHFRLFVLSLLSLGAVPRHHLRDSCVLWPLLVFDKRRSWRSNDLWPTVGRVTVRVEQPSIGLRAIIKHVHAQLPMLDLKHRREILEILLRLEHVLCHLAIHETAAKPRIGAHRDFIRSALSDSSDNPSPDWALGSTSEQQRPPLLAVNVTKSTKILQVFVKTFAGKSITINNVTGRTLIEDLKLKIKEKAGMRGVWPELKYQGAWLHDGKILSTYGIDQAATLEMTWRLLGGGLSPAPAPNTWAESSHAAANAVVPLDENNAAKPGPRPQPVSPCIATAYYNEGGARAHAAHQPPAAFVDQSVAQQHDATDSRTMVESLGHSRSRIMALRNVESLLDSDEHVTDALPHNVEASKVANEALVLDSAALNGIDAGLARESTGVFCHFHVPFYARPWRLSRTHASARQMGHSHSF